MPNGLISRGLGRHKVLEIAFKGRKTDLFLKI
jgi:hypothetical protein